MKRSFFTGVIVTLVVAASPAAAWEPPEEEWIPFPDPVEAEPRWEPPAVDVPEQPAFELPEQPVFEVPEGVYYVTDTYVRDVVASEGATTSYSTETVHESTGSYARVVDVVETGASSVYDGSSFNGRAAFSDGTSVAGTYYENFVLTDQGYVSVSIVFFQDDSVTVTRPPSEPAAPNPPPASDTPGVPVPPETAPVAAPNDRPAEQEQPSRPEREPVVRPARAGVALAADGPTLPYAEVLRGRQVRFWPRAFVGDAPVAVSSWRLVSSSPDRISASAGATEPLVAQWLRMPSPTESVVLVFELSTDAAPGQVLTAAIAVAVRSPALVD